MITFCLFGLWIYSYSDWIDQLTLYEPSLEEKTGYNVEIIMDSVKPFKSKNRNKIYLEALKKLYHNLFSDLDLEPPDKFYRDFSIWTVSH